MNGFTKNAKHGVLALGNCQSGLELRY